MCCDDVLLMYIMKVAGTVRARCYRQHRRQHRPDDRHLRLWDCYDQWERSDEWLRICRSQASQHHNPVCADTVDLVTTARTCLEQLRTLPFHDSCFVVCRHCGTLITITTCAKRGTVASVGQAHPSFWVDVEALQQDAATATTTLLQRQPPAKSMKSSTV